MNTPETSAAVIPAETKNPLPNIVMQDVASSQMYSIGHDPEANVLAIRFINYQTKGPGALWHYKMDAEDFAKFSAAPSLGKHLKEVIKANPEKHAATKIEF